MSGKFDLKNHPKFKDKVAKLERNQYAKIIHDPVQVRIDDTDWYVVAIGLNDSYLVVSPSVGDHIPGSAEFCVEWTKSDGFQKSTPLHEHVSNVMLNWIMLQATDSSVKKVKHSEVRITELATAAWIRIKGEDYAKSVGPTFTAIVQGIIRDQIKNPLHK